MLACGTQLLLDYLTGQVETSFNIQFTDEVHRATALAGKRQLAQAGVPDGDPLAKHARSTCSVWLILSSSTRVLESEN